MFDNINIMLVISILITSLMVDYQNLKLKMKKEKGMSFNFKLLVIIVVTPLTYVLLSFVVAVFSAVNS